jgi:hypothetical protein
VSFAGVTFLSRSVLGHLTGGPSNSMFLTLSPLLCDTAIGMCFHAQNGFVQCQLLRYLRGRAFASPLVGVKSVWLLDTVLVHAGASMHTMTVSASCDEARVWPSMHATSMGCQDSQPFNLISHVWWCICRSMTHHAAYLPGVETHVINQVFLQQGCISCEHTERVLVRCKHMLHRMNKPHTMCSVSPLQIAN